MTGVSLLNMSRAMTLTATGCYLPTRDMTDALALYQTWEMMAGWADGGRAGGWWVASRDVAAQADAKSTCMVKPHIATEAIVLAWCREG